MKKIILMLFVLTLMPLLLQAKPQYAVIQGFGTKCQSCHIAPNLGMQRNNSGWMSRNEVSLIKPKTLGMEKLFNALSESNQTWDDKITFGMDFRYQTARWGNPTQKTVTYPNFEDPSRDTVLTYTNPYGTKRDYMVMILTPYLQVEPIEGLSISGSYNFAYEIETKKRYPGQLAYTAAVSYKPAEWLPSITAGYLQPPVGTDWDDHTFMTRTFVTSTATPPTIPCDYIELGAQLDYQSLDWLGVTLGVYDSKNLAIITQDYTQDKTLSGLFKVTLHPPDFGTGINAFCGGSIFVNSQLKSDNGLYFANDYFTLSNIFFHFGMTDKFAVMTEWIRTEANHARVTNNYSVELSYLVYEPIIVYARLERGNSEFIRGAQSLFYHGNRYTLGSKIFVLPYVALMPELKIYDRTHVDSYASQFACQLHIFY